MGHKITFLKKLILFIPLNKYLKIVPMKECELNSE